MYVAFIQRLKECTVLCEKLVTEIRCIEVLSDMGECTLSSLP